MTGGDQRVAPAGDGLWRRVWASMLRRPVIWRGCAMAAAAFLALLITVTAIWPSDLLLRQLQSWHIFHYVLGAKYFDELGYWDTYEGVVLADAEDGGPFTRLQGARDLRTYYWKPMPRILEQARARGIRQRFSAARWAEFKGDLVAMQRLRSPRRWAGPLLDRGFNPSPAWVGPHRWLLNAVDIQNKRTLFFLGNVQLVFYFLTFAVLWWAFGPRTTLLISLWYLLYFGSWGILGGGYFSCDWLFCTLCAVGLYRKGHPVAAGPPLALAAMTRGFPGMLAFHAALAWIGRAARRRRPRRRHTLFLVSLGLCCLVLVGLGSTTSHGPRGWLEWKDKISLHSQKHQYTANIIGFRNVMVHDYRRWNWNPSLGSQERDHEPYSGQNVALGLGLGLLVLLAMLGRGDHDGQLLGIAAAFFTVVLSRYYFALGGLLFTWTGQDLSKQKRFYAALWLWALLAGGYMQILLVSSLTRQLYYYFNVGLTVYFLELVASFLVRDLGALRGAGRGINRK